MTERLPFSKIKLQYLLEAVTDHDLDDNAFRALAYLVLAHANHENGESHPSFETIGDAIGKHAKSVKRALNKVEKAGFMSVERGKNKGRSSRYRPTETAILRATLRRREGDNIVPLSRPKGGQYCPQSGTKLSSKGGQDCPPNKEQEIRKENAHASARERPDENQSENTSWEVPDLVFVPRSICFVQDWNDRLHEEGMPLLERCLPISKHEYREGFWLPAKRPAPVGTGEWTAQLVIVRKLILDYSQGPHSDDTRGSCAVGRG